MRTPKNFSAEAGLGEFLERFGLEAEPRLLSDWHARTYEVRREGQPFILRVTAAAHRRAEEILGEVAWMGFLRGRGLCVPEIPASRGGREVETEGDFSAVLFEKLTGRAVAEGDFRGGGRWWGGCIVSGRGSSGRGGGRSGTRPIFSMWRLIFRRSWRR